LLYLPLTFKTYSWLFSSISLFLFLYNVV
jgi:hypothetical protein